MVFGNPDTFFHYALSSLYLLCLSGLFLYGTNCYVLLLRFRRYRRKGLVEYRRVLKAFEASSWSNDLPQVTVQLPIYNELLITLVTDWKFSSSTTPLTIPRKLRMPLLRAIDSKGCL